MSNDQLLECLASMSAVMGSAGAATGGGNSGGGGSNTHTEIPDEYWVLVRGRSVASLMGVVVGVLGVRGAHSLSTQTLQMYYVGLVMCAIVSIVIRVEVLVDIIAGKVSGVGLGRLGSCVFAGQPFEPVPRLAGDTWEGGGEVCASAGDFYSCVK